MKEEKLTIAMRNTNELRNKPDADSENLRHE